MGKKPTKTVGERETANLTPGKDFFIPRLNISVNAPNAQEARKLAEAKLAERGKIHGKEKASRPDSVDK